MQSVCDNAAINCDLKKLCKSAAISYKPVAICCLLHTKKFTIKQKLSSPARKPHISNRNSENAQIVMY